MVVFVPRGDTRAFQPADRIVWQTGCLLPGEHDTTQRKPHWHDPNWWLTVEEEGRLDLPLQSVILRLWGSRVSAPLSDIGVARTTLEFTLQWEKCKWIWRQCIELSDNSHPLLVNGIVKMYFNWWWWKLVPRRHGFCPGAQKRHRSLRFWSLNCGTGNWTEC